MKKRQASKNEKQIQKQRIKEEDGGGGMDASSSTSSLKNQLSNNPM